MGEVRSSNNEEKSGNLYKSSQMAIIAASGAAIYAIFNTWVSTYARCSALWKVDEANIWQCMGAVSGSLLVTLESTALIAVSIYVYWMAILFPKLKKTSPQFLFTVPMIIVVVICSLMLIMTSY